jgi:hypothetical protein
MFQHPDVTMALVHDRQRELVAEADRQRLLSRVRRSRHAKRTVRGPDLVAVDTTSRFALR